MYRVAVLAAFSLWLLQAPAQAGLYYSGEPLAELPSQWRGFLLDYRALAMAAVPPRAGTPVSPLREQYQKCAAELEHLSRSRPLTADEAADLGALYVRLGEVGRAIELLRRAQVEHPNHFCLAANLGTAWHANGDLPQAAIALGQAVRLAPGKWQLYEEYHLKLVRLRLQEPKGSFELDNLFGVVYIGDGGQFQAGKLAAGEMKKLPARAAAVAQQLALWLPSDPRLLWQLAELANAYGDVRLAANMMDGCVTQLGLSSPQLRQHRHALKAALEKLPQPAAGKTEHEGHSSQFPARSLRPLLTRVDPSSLPVVSATGVNALPWDVLRETAINRNFNPSFTPYLKELNGKQVTLTGFVQPFADELEISSCMLIEFPVGCWFCEQPELNGILHVQLPQGRTANYTRGLVRVTGRLVLNATDPEEFLYSIRDAKVVEAD